MRGGIRQDAEKKRRRASTIRRKRRRVGESGVVWTLGERDIASGRKKHCNVASGRKERCDASQDVRNVATQVRTHRTHGTQNIRCLRQDATPADQTQDLFLLMQLMSASSIQSILVYPQSGYLLVYHMGLSLVRCSYLSLGSLHVSVYAKVLRSYPSCLFLDI